MTLSTAQPMLNASPPELCMLQPVLVNRGSTGGLAVPSGAARPFASQQPSGHGSEEQGQGSFVRRRAATTSADEPGKQKDADNSS